jgi:hypothetical protein
MQEAQCAPITEYDMGSKTPPKCKPFLSTQEDDEFSDREAPSKEVAARLLVGRIAGALQIPAAAFYNLPGATTSVRRTGSAGTIDADLDRQCNALLQAFRRIDDAELRHRLLSLVQAAAGSD